MQRSEILALLASVYLAAMFLWHRIALFRRRRAGPPLPLLERFDYRAVWDELVPDFETIEGASAPGADSALAPRFYAFSPWELAQPPVYRDLRDRLAAGHAPDADARDPPLAWLYCHFAVRRMLAGELDGVEALARRLGPPQGARLLATVELLRAERSHAQGDETAARRSAQAAQAAAERAVGQAGSSPGLEYLLVHLRLRWFSHAGNLEWAVWSASRRLRGALRRWGPRPGLLLALAHAHALLGRSGRAVDELGRALYFSRGDPFYARAILESDYVLTVRPALVAQCRTLCARRSENGPGEEDGPPLPGRME